MLCSGCAQRSRPCDHYRLSCTDDPWLIWLFFILFCFFCFSFLFFMSSAFFAINAFVLKTDFQLFLVFAVVQPPLKAFSNSCVSIAPKIAQNLNSEIKNWSWEIPKFWKISNIAKHNTLGWGGFSDLLIQTYRNTISAFMLFQLRPTGSCEVRPL